jgi:hypothetical protein
MDGIIGTTHGKRRSTVLSVALIAVIAQGAAAQGTLPFGTGERLTYHVRVDKMGASGRGTMWIEGPVEVRGTPTLLLRSAVEVGIGPIKAINHTDSWLDAARMTSLRFEQRHRYLWSRRNSDVQLYPDEMRWTGSKGDSGASLTATPLDELSFIYFIRTLPLEPDSSWSLNHHFEAERNPVCIKVIGRETLRTALGESAVIVAELRVKDPRFTGEGVIRLFLSDDSDRVPLRIESSLPGLGNAVFTLESFVRAPQRVAAGGR